MIICTPHYHIDYSLPIPMPLKVRFADAGSLCMYNKEGLDESEVLGIVDSMAAGGVGMCESDSGVNEPVVKGISGREEVCSTSDRSGNGGDRYGGIRGDRLVSEKSSDRKGEMVAGVNRQRVEGVNQRSGIGDSRREMVVNAARKDGAGWEAINSGDRDDPTW